MKRPYLLSLLILGALCSSSFASAPVPLIWSSGNSPSQSCWNAFNGALANVSYGLFTSFQCTLSNGALSAPAFLSLSCPIGYQPDFSIMSCVEEVTKTGGLFNSMYSQDLLAAVGMALILALGIIAGLLS